MIIPTYNNDTMPCISYPYEQTTMASEKGFGGKSITGEVYATVNLVSENDAKIQALYEFWKTECNYGLEPFILNIPHNGDITKASLVQFYEDLKVTKEEALWKSTISLKVLGIIYYVIDDLGNYILSDEGDFVIINNDTLVSTINLNLFKGVTYEYY